MVEYGEFFWKDGWGPLYSVLGGNPLAAMPSLHFATSMMAAQLLAETGPVAGALGWGYTATLGFALVYLGEHYVVDLIAGAALTTAVRRLGPQASPALRRFGAAVAAIEARAQERYELRGDEMSAADSSERERADQEEIVAAGDSAVTNGKAVDQEDASAPADPAASDGRSGDEQMPRVPVTRRSAVAFGVFVLSAVAFLYFVLPKLAGFSSTAHRIESGDTWWIVIGVLLEICSFAGYVVLFRAVFVRDPSPIGWSESYQITMAGLAATRLFAAAGAGGIALTAWALRRSGMEPRLVACRMVAFMVLLYVIYAGAVLLDGIGMGTGLLPGEGSFALTIVPAVVAAIAVRGWPARWRCCQATSSGVWLAGRPARAAWSIGWHAR